MNNVTFKVEKLQTPLSLLAPGEMGIFEGLIWMRVRNCNTTGPLAVNLKTGVTTYADYGVTPFIGEVTINNMHGDSTS